MALKCLILSHTCIHLISVAPCSVFGFLGSDVQVKKMQKAALKATPTPIDPSGWPDRFPAKVHCSKCGLCETSFVSHVVDACAFLDEGMARIDQLEVKIHGRGRDVSNMEWTHNGSSKEKSGLPDEGRFGVLHQPMMLARGVGVPNAQWTGCVTGIALSMLASGMVDAVICIANEDRGEKGQWSSPEPIIAKTAEDVLRGRGVKPALAPSLRVLDEINRDTTIRKLLFCGVGCAVQGECLIYVLTIGVCPLACSFSYLMPTVALFIALATAFRSVQHKLDLDEIYVLGTNCADNSPTPKAAQNFIKNGVKVQEADIRGYEFMQVSSNYVQVCVFVAMIHVVLSNFIFWVIN